MPFRVRAASSRTPARLAAFALAATLVVGTAACTTDPGSGSGGTASPAPSVSTTWVMQPSSPTAAAPAVPSTRGLTRATATQVEGLTAAAATAPAAGLSGATYWHTVTQVFGRTLEGSEITDTGVYTYDREVWSNLEGQNWQRYRRATSASGGAVTSSADSSHQGAIGRAETGRQGQEQGPLTVADVPRWLSRLPGGAPTTPRSEFTVVASALTRALSPAQRASFVAHLTDMDGVAVYADATDSQGRKGFVIERVPEASADDFGGVQAVVLRPDDSMPLEVWQVSDTAAAANQAPAIESWIAILGVGTTSERPAELLTAAQAGEAGVSAVVPQSVTEKPSVEGLKRLDLNDVASRITWPTERSSTDGNVELQALRCDFELPGEYVETYGGYDCGRPMTFWFAPDGRSWGLDGSGEVTPYADLPKVDLSALPTDDAGIAAWIDTHKSPPPPNYPLEDAGRFSYVTSLLPAGTSDPASLQLSESQRSALLRYAVEKLDAGLYEATDRLGRKGVLLHRTVDGGDFTDNEIEAVLIGSDGTALETWEAEPPMTDGPTAKPDSESRFISTVTMLSTRSDAKLPDVVER